MKRIGGLFDSIGGRDNLSRAVWRAAAGKRQVTEVREFLDGLDRELEAMRQIASGLWSFAPYRAFSVRDTKTRTIHAPSFRDRVVHHAIIAVTGHVFESGALHQSYACRRGKGQHAALDAARPWVRGGTWYGKMDVRKFYDSVDHAVLRRLLARRFRERRLLALFNRLIDSYSASPGKGLPIGALTSQYLGNFYLDEFDRRMKASSLVPKYVRYMDDILVFGDPASLQRARSSAVEILAFLGLTLKHGGEWNRCERGVPFLGFVLYPGRVRLNREGRKRLRRKFHEVEKDFESGVISELDLQSRVSSLFAHARTADDAAWRRTVISSGVSGEREAPKPRARRSRRLLEQHRQELPLGVSQQQEVREPQQEPGLPPRVVFWNEDQPPMAASADVALSCSSPASGPDESSGKSPANLDIPGRQQPQRRWENRSAGAPPLPEAGE